MRWYADICFHLTIFMPEPRAIQMEDIKDLADIRIFVDAFYDKVKRDPQIGPVFFAAIGNNWQPHLNRLYAFWDSVLFSSPGFRGNPFAKHIGLPITQVHFDKWLLLFSQTIDAHFAGPTAQEAKNRAELIAKVFVSRLEFMRAKQADHIG